MSATKQILKMPLPQSFAELVALMPPQAIQDVAQHEEVLEVIDRLMSVSDLTTGQKIYLETLVQLVQSYEAAHDAIGMPKGLDALRHLLDEHEMNASELARLLDMHASMGSKILRGDRALTVEHLQTLAKHFKVRPDTFMD